VPNLLLNHWHRHTRHQRINHMTMPEDVGRDLPPGKLLPGRNLLDPGLICQTVYCPEHRLGTKVSGAPAREEPHLARLNALPDSLQSSLAHPSGPEMPCLRSGALNPDEPIMKVYVRNPGSDQLPHPAAQVIEAKED